MPLSVLEAFCERAAGGVHGGRRRARHPHPRGPRPARAAATTIGRWPPRPCGCSTSPAWPRASPVPPSTPPTAFRWPHVRERWLSAYRAPGPRARWRRRRHWRRHERRPHVRAPAGDAALGGRGTRRHGHAPRNRPSGLEAARAAVGALASWPTRSTPASRACARSRRICAGPNGARRTRSCRICSPGGNRGSCWPRRRAPALGARHPRPVSRRRVRGRPARATPFSPGAPTSSGIATSRWRHAATARAASTGIHDPVNQRTACDGHWSEVPYLSPECGDHKVIWELNRHQQWLDARPRVVPDRRGALSRRVHPPAARLDVAEPAGERDQLGQHAGAVVPRPVVGLGAAPVRPATGAGDVGARSRRGPSTCCSGCDRQLSLVEHNLSTFFSPNTHLLGEALGLYVAGRSLPELRRASAWSQIGRQVLLDEMDHQIHADGGHVELSLHYHRYTLDFYLLALRSRASLTTRTPPPASPMACCAWPASPRPWPTTAPCSRASAMTMAACCFRCAGWTPRTSASRCRWRRCCSSVRSWATGAGTSRSRG